MWIVHIYRVRDSSCARFRTVALTWSQAAKYFSMHWVKHVFSLEDRLDPGFEIHFSKQFSSTLYERYEGRVSPDCRERIVCRWDSRQEAPGYWQCWIPSVPGR